MEGSQKEGVGSRETLIGSNQEQKMRELFSLIFNSHQNF